MRPAVAKTVHRVEFGNKPEPRRDSSPVGRVPRVARMLALAHRIDGMIRAGELTDLADAARRLGITRARMTQIANLALLAPAIQEAILLSASATQERELSSERALRPLTSEWDWTHQLQLLSQKEK